MSGSKTATEAALGPAPLYDKLVPALSRVMDECGYIQKGGSNPEFGYSFASDTDILSAVRPSMVKHGLVLFPTTCECHVQHHADSKQGTPMFRADVVQGFRLAHKSGQYVDLQTAGCGTDSQDKATYKALTGCQKYLLKLLVMFATGDDPEYVSPAEKEEEAKKAREDRSKKHYERLSDLILKGKWPMDVARAANELPQIRGQLTDEHYQALRKLGAQRKEKEAQGDTADV